MPGIQESVAIPAGLGARYRRLIVFTTFGSLSDLHPYIAVALGLPARGHEAVIVTSGYRQKIEALGIGFRAVRPDHPDPDGDAGLMRRIMDRRTGSEFVMRQLMM
jgi:UDP:flavonoid glycosyltransferase YjiC (YdhE family)